MQKIIYRKATINDTIEIASLVAKLIGTCNLDKTKSILDNNIDEISTSIDKYYVCIINGHVVGACGISDLKVEDEFDLKLKNIREILYFVVEKEHQRNGIGTTLLNKVCKGVKEKILYEAWGDNGKYVNSKYVLERCGFELIKDLGNSYYYQHNYCSFCVNNNKNCNSCLAQIWIKQN